MRDAPNPRSGGRGRNDVVAHVIERHVKTVARQWLAAQTMVGALACGDLGDAACRVGIGNRRPKKSMDRPVQPLVPPPQSSCAQHRRLADCKVESWRRYEQSVHGCLPKMGVPYMFYRWTSQIY